ncbi:MAG: hypothetical protein Q8N03_04065 [Ignavibacteria bacterium]|nr:hypothetical protein [Ignavibacteria bacterium]
MKIFKQKYVIVTIALFLIVTTKNSYSQEFGFGCLGFVGGFVGFESSAFKPNDFNNYVSDFNETRKDTLSQQLDSFGDAKGFRFGINFFRHNYNGLLITLKSSFSSLNQKNNAAFLSNNLTFTHSYDLQLQNFAIGVDFGTSISSLLDWKVIDAALILNRTKLTRTRNSPNQSSQIDNYSAEKIAIGYTLGSGFILKIVSDYISLEGSIGFTFFEVGRMKNSENNSYLTYRESSDVPMEKFIKAGGLSGIIQLNLSFPL